MFVRSPSAWYQTRDDQQGLRRRRQARRPGDQRRPAWSASVETVTRRQLRRVTLITDQDFAVSAGIAARTREPGTIRRRSAAPGDLLLRPRLDVSRTCAPAISSSPPARTAARPAVAVPAGDPDRDGASGSTPATGELDRRIHVTPAADVAHARPRPGADQARTPTCGPPSSDASPRRIRLPPGPDRPARRACSSSARCRRSRSSACPADLVAAAGGRPRASRRLDPGAVFGFGLGLFMDTSTSPDARRDVAGLHRRRLRRRAHPRAARPRARPRAGGRRRGGDGGRARSASRCCSSCSASTRRCRSCCCARS